MSSRKSEIPMRTITKDGVQNGEQFAQTSHNGNFLLFACFEQTLIHLADDWIASGRRKSCHVQDGTDIWTSTADKALSAPASTVSIVRSDTNQSCDLFAITLSEFRDIRNEFGGGLLSNP